MKYVLLVQVPNIGVLSFQLPISNSTWENIGIMVEIDMKYFLLSLKLKKLKIFKKNQFDTNNN